MSAFAKESPQQVLKVNEELGIAFGFAAISHRFDPVSKSVVPYFDLGSVRADGKRYRDHIPENAILRQGLDFMSNHRVAGDLHKSAAVDALQKALDALPDDVAPEVRAEAKALVERAQRPSLVDPADKALGKVEQRGDVPFGFPLTRDIAAELEITSNFYGFLAGIRPDRALLDKFKSGEYTGLSIGGVRGTDRIVEAGNGP